MLISVYSAQISCHSSNRKLTRQEYHLSLKKLLLCKSFHNQNPSDSFADSMDLPIIIDNFCHCSTLLVSLTYLLRNKQTKKKKNAKLLLQNPALNVFREAKDVLANFTKLNYLSDEENTARTLTTDASTNTVGAVL